MAYRYGNREQVELLPPSIDDYVGPDDPVRAYDAFVEALNLKELGIIHDAEKVGNSQYDPRTMLKLFIYGYSYGNDRSSRKLERAVHHNLSFIWLLGGLKPDHKTIANFRKNNKNALEQVLKQSARMCLRLGLIEGNTLFFDGTKLRANASIKNTWNDKRCQETLAKVDKRIKEIMVECEKMDTEEFDSASLVKLQEEFTGKQALQEKVKAILSDLKQHEGKSINTVDSDCVSTKSTHGSYAGYNAQIAVDEKHGLIASCDVVSRSSDQGQLLQQIQKATESLSKECKTAVADAGYSDLEDLSKVDAGIEVLVPIQRQAEDHGQFIYNKDTNTYCCPAGQTLKQFAIDDQKKRIRYKPVVPSHCLTCTRFGTCTKSKKGRLVSRSFFEETSQRLQARFNNTESQRIYNLRCQKVELPFGHLRRTMGVRSFLIRGLSGVKAEMSLFASAFNIRRMITVSGGVMGFISLIRSR